MRALLAALALGLACGPLHAQSEKELKKTEKKKPASHGHTVSKDAQLPKGQRSAAAKQRHEEQERRRAQKQQQFDPARPQDQRAKERVAGDPPPDHRRHTVSRDAQPPKGQTSPANQLQQKQSQQRQTQLQNRDDDNRRTVQCTARPVCGGGGYGRCASVQQTYRGGTEQSRRQDMVNECIGANTPDTCNCAVQCRRVAQCSIF